MALGRKLFGSAKSPNNKKKTVPVLQQDNDETVPAESCLNEGPIPAAGEECTIPKRLESTVQLLISKIETTSASFASLETNSNVFPEIDLNDPSQVQQQLQLVRRLKGQREIQLKQTEQKQQIVRSRIVEMEKENVVLKSENQSLLKDCNARKQQVLDYEKKMERMQILVETIEGNLKQVRNEKEKEAQLRMKLDRQLKASRQKESELEEKIRMSCEAYRKIQANHEKYRVHCEELIKKEQIKIKKLVAIAFQGEQEEDTRKKKNQLEKLDMLRQYLADDLLSPEMIQALFLPGANSQLVVDQLTHESPDQEAKKQERSNFQLCPPFSNGKKSKSSHASQLRKFGFVDRNDNEFNSPKNHYEDED